MSTETPVTVKSLADLRAEYLARHWQDADDAVKKHLAGFVAHVEDYAAAVEASFAPGASAMPGVAESLAASPAPAGSAPDPHAVAVTETKTYPDGTVVTGPGPLPDQSPAQQDAAAAPSA